MYNKVLFDWFNIMRKLNKGGYKVSLTFKALL